MAQLFRQYDGGMTSQVWAASPSADDEPPAGEPRWLDAEEQKAWRAWLYSSLLLQDRLDPELTPQTGNSPPDYEILVALSGTPGPVMRVSGLPDPRPSSPTPPSPAGSREGGARRPLPVPPQPPLARGLTAGGARLGAPPGLSRRRPRSTRRPHRRGLRRPRGGGAHPRRERAHAPVRPADPAADREHARHRRDAAPPPRPFL